MIPSKTDDELCRMIAAYWHDKGFLDVRVSVVLENKSPHIRSNLQNALLPQVVARKLRRVA